MVTFNHNFPDHTDQVLAIWPSKIRVSDFIEEVNGCIGKKVSILEQTDSLIGSGPESSWMTTWDTNPSPDRFTYVNRTVRLTKVIKLVDIPKTSTIINNVEHKGR